MKSTYTYQILILLILFPIVLLNAQTTYTWNLAGSGSWTTSTNWTPTRSSLAINDIMVINNGGTKNITNIPTQSIGRLLINNSTNITLQGSGTVALTVGNSTGDDIVVASGSSLTVGGSNNLTVTLATSSTADISGTLTINSSRIFNTNGTSVVTTVTGSIVNAGTVTNTTASKLLFNNGSSYQHSQNGGNVPTATWNVNSNCSITGVVGTLPTNLGQSFGNLTWNCPGQTATTIPATAYNIQGNLTIQNTGTGEFRVGDFVNNVLGNYSQTGGSFRLGSATARTLNVSGNFSLSNGTITMSAGAAIGTINIAGNISHTGGTITESSTGSGLIIFNGSTNQSYSGGGIISGTINYTINNLSGITLLSSAAFPASLTMTSGNIALNGNTLTLGTGSTTLTKGTLNWTSGFMTGTGAFIRWFDNNTAIVIGTNAGLFPMGNGTDNRSVWIAGTPSVGGTVSVQHNNSAGTNSLSFTENTQSFDKRTNMNWILTNANGFTGSSLSLRIQGSGIPGISSISDLNISLASGAVGGTYSPAGGTTSNPQVNRSGLTQATLANTFYFAATSASPLPVELSSFSAIVLENAIKLIWRTETEVSNYGFEIERASSSTTPVQDWKKIGFEQGHGNSNSPKEYSFIDQNITAGKYSYRLKQIDTDGNFEYSKMIEIDLGSPGKFELSQNYPNPFNPSTTINFSLTQPENVKLIVYNTIGEQVAEIVNGFKEAGIHSINFNASGLKSGVYIYRIEANGFVQSRKMTLLK